MVQNDPTAKKNTTITRKKNEKIHFGGILGCFCPFLFVFEHFGGSKIEKCSKFFFAGIDLEWSKTHFKTKI